MEKLHLIRNGANPISRGVHRHSQWNRRTGNSICVAWVSAEIHKFNGICACACFFPTICFNLRASLLSHYLRGPREFTQAFHDQTPTKKDLAWPAQTAAASLSPLGKCSPRLHIRQQPPQCFSYILWFLVMRESAKPKVTSGGAVLLLP